MIGSKSNLQRDLARLRQELDRCPAKWSIEAGFRALGGNRSKSFRYTVDIRPELQSGPRPRNLVFCFDGSWNDPASKTNVHRLAQLLVNDGIRQKGWYYPGVGVREDIGPKRDMKSNWRRALDSAAENWFGSVPRVKDWLEKRAGRIRPETTKELLGGTLGKGAKRIRRRAYFDLLCNFRPGDRVFLFGFSRGAAIARVFANQVCRKGIPEALSAEFEKSGLEGDTIDRPLRFGVTRIEKPPIEMLGAWDTVASFGNPGEPIIELFKKDLTVAENIGRAYHLVAIDERRKAFAPSLMRGEEKVEEIWFPGVHTNVGGGYSEPAENKPDHGVSDLALRFMINRSRDHELLLLDKTQLDPPLAPDWLGPIEPAPWPGGKEDREIRVEGDPTARPRLHQSVLLRRDADLQPRYQPAPLTRLEGRWQTDTRD